VVTWPIDLRLCGSVEFRVSPQGIYIGGVVLWVRFGRYGFTYGSHRAYKSFIVLSEGKTFIPPVHRKKWYYSKKMISNED
jgi:hypothetical protein